MRVEEIACTTALSPSRLPGLDYALNPYVGCEHACVYCYASLNDDSGEWGEKIKIKMNLPFVLSKELRRKKRGVVGVGTMTDPYQPVEKKYEITRHALEQLLRADFPICIQTKSDLVVSDVELIKRFSEKEVGLTITTLDDGARKKYEPFSSSVEERLAALAALNKNGIPTWAFIGPIMPFITDRELPRLIGKIAEAGTKHILFDGLRLKKNTWASLERFLSAQYPDYLAGYKKILFSYEEKRAYFSKAERAIEEACKKEDVACERAF